MYATGRHSLSCWVLSNKTVPNPNEDASDKAVDQVGVKQDKHLSRAESCRCPRPIDFCTKKVTQGITYSLYHLIRHA